jgi:ubiquinone/menaquinone biosynthesis C-methylase UbiE
LFYTALRTILRVVYSLLYHPFAWTYDWVAGLVSLGQWNAWVKEVIPFVQGKKVLEIGFGPGHLQFELCQKGYQVFGIDESFQMIKQAAKKLEQIGKPINLVRGLSQNLPFDSLFNTIIATFPSDYIFDLGTISEIAQTLEPGGRLIILLGIFPSYPKSKLSGLLSDTKFISGIDKFIQKMEQLCLMYGDKEVNTKIVRIPKGSATLYILVGEKSYFQNDVANIIPTELL